jgi:hypothetical protein
MKGPKSVKRQGRPASASKSRAAASGKRKPRGKRVRTRPYEGPLSWLVPMMEQAYARLLPKDQAERLERAAEKKRKRAPGAKQAKAAKGAAQAFRSAMAADQGEEVLAPVQRDFWLDRLREYQQRKAVVNRSAAAARAALAGPAMPAAPAIPGLNNWVPLGPSVVARGQAQGRPAISGRVSGIAIAPGGTRHYVATALGGVWRSDDAGRSWKSTMDGFDTNPNAFAATSLTGGAIAIDPADPDRVYVGTGEGDTDALFNSRLTNALPSYRGIGPIRSDDGGVNWVSEPSTPSLVGFAFFQIAVDPVDREHCVAATTNGLYERVPVGMGFEWQRRRTGIHSSVVVARAAGVTTWFAAAWGVGVFSSGNGNTWSSLGTGFPAGSGRIALGVQPDNPNVLYALIAASGTGVLNSVRRLDSMSGAWKNVSGTPNVLPVDLFGNSQGAYDLCIAVDPNNANLIYLGGSYFNDGSIYPGSIWRASVSPSGPAYAMATTHIGAQAHADVHVLLHTPGNSNELWTGTDGGLFLNPDADGVGTFESRNTGLATLAANYFAQHPTEPAVLYTGLQDNGTAKCTGEMVWRHVLFADGGYCVVNWADPFRVLMYANGKVYRATDGGLDWSSWANVTPATNWLLMAEPLVSAPYHPGSPAEADIVALGAGPKVFVSSNFGTSWPAADTVTLPAGSGSIYSMIFASSTRIFLGTTNGRVFRINKGANWSSNPPVRIDNVVGGPLPLAGMIADIAVDTSDATLNSIYICFGGVGDFRHVWRFDGISWAARSGPAGGGTATNLLDVEHNAIQYDGVTGRVYVAADIGVWETSDGGANWSVLENGLPDAAVLDLQIHKTLRLLRASLHGRGLFELKLDAPVQPDVELYVRDTMLDTARGINTDFRDDPSIFPTAPVAHWLSPNIKVDVPTPLGYQTPTTAIDFFTFNEGIVDGSNGVGTIDPPPTVHNRVYVEVHNRGRVDAADVQVMAAITNASAGLGPLPAGYTANVVAGTNIPSASWTTLGVQHLFNLRAGFPQIAAFDLPSTVLPLPASLPGQSHFCLLAFVHSAQDAFTSVQQNVDLLTVSDRKVGQHNLHIVEFIGVPPPPATGIGMWAMLDVNGGFFREKRLIDLVFDAKKFPGTISLVLPPKLFPQKPDQQAKGWRVASNELVAKWFRSHSATAERLFAEAKYPASQFKKLQAAMKTVMNQKPLSATGGGQFTITGLPLLPDDQHTLFMRIDPPQGAKVGSTWDFDVQVRDPEKRVFHGGSRYRVVVNKSVRR